MTEEQYLEIGKRLRERDASLNPDPECCARLVRCVVDAINESGHHLVVEVEEDSFDPEAFRNAISKAWGARGAAGR